MNTKPLFSLVLFLISGLFQISCRQDIPPQTNAQDSAKTESNDPVMSLIELDNLMDQVIALLKQKAPTDRPTWQAIRVLEDLVKRVPQHAYASRLLASLLLQVQEGERASKMYQTYLTRFPSDMNTRLVLAKLYMTQGRMEAGLDQLKYVILTNPETWIPYQLMAEIAHDRGLLQDAKKYMDTAENLKEQGNPAKPGLVILEKYLSPQRAQSLYVSMENHPRINKNPKLKPLQNFLE